MMREAIGYIRVPMARQERSGLGLEAQRAAIARFAEAEAFNLWRPSPRPRAARTMTGRS